MVVSVIFGVRKAQLFYEIKQVIAKYSQFWGCQQIKIAVPQTSNMLSTALRDNDDDIYDFCFQNYYVFVF